MLQLKTISVDDEFLEYISIILKATFKIETINFELAKNAIEYTKSHSSEIDLILTGWCMPGMDGLEMLKNIDGILKKPAYAILFSGALEENGTTVNEFYNMKYSCIKPLKFFKKPFNWVELKNTIERINTQ